MVGGTQDDLGCPMLGKNNHPLIFMRGIQSKNKVDGKFIIFLI